MKVVPTQQIGGETDTVNLVEPMWIFKSTKCVCTGGFLGKETKYFKLFIILI